MVSWIQSQSKNSGNLRKEFTAAYPERKDYISTDLKRMLRWIEDGWSKFHSMLKSVIKWANIFLLPELVESLKRVFFTSWEHPDLGESVKHICFLISSCPEISLSTTFHCQSWKVKYCCTVLAEYSFNVIHMSSKTLRENI